MARKQTLGLKYYWVDTDFENNPKFSIVEEIILKQGASVYECLVITKITQRILGYIYSLGYYVPYENYVNYIAGRGLAQFGIYSEHVERIIVALINCGYFDKVLFDKHGILTSYEIQQSWLKAMAAMRRKGRINNEYRSSENNFGRNPELTPLLRKIRTPGVITSEETVLIPGFSISQYSQSVIQSVGQTEAHAQKNRSPEAGREPGANTPVAAAPSYEGQDEVDVGLVRSPSECEEIFLKHTQFKETRYQIMSRFRIMNYDLFYAWVRAFGIWLKEGKLNAPKDLEDFVKHLRSWLTTINLDQTPEEFLETQKPKPKKPYVSTSNTGAGPDLSKSNNQRMGKGF